jgi:hypothetical protein
MIRPIAVFVIRVRMPSGVWLLSAEIEALPDASTNRRRSPDRTAFPVLAREFPARHFKFPAPMSREFHCKPLMLRGE